MDVRVGLWRKLSAEELRLLNCGVGEDLESPLDCKEIQPVHSEGDQPWVFLGRNDAKAETPVLWPPHAKSWLIGKDSDAVRDWGQEEKGATEDEMAGWHHWFNRCEFEWTPGIGDGQEGLACCNSRGHKELGTTEWLNWTELNWTSLVAQKVQICLQSRRSQFDPWDGKNPWRREWLLTPVLQSGEFHGQTRLVDYNSWGHKQLDMTATKHVAQMILYFSWTQDQF